MYRYIDSGQAAEIAHLIGDVAEEAGYTKGEVMAGCIQAVVTIASDYPGTEDDVLDEAASFLADGGLSVVDDGLDDNEDDDDDGEVPYVSFDQ